MTMKIGLQGRRQLNKAKDRMLGLHARMRRHASMPCALLGHAYIAPGLYL